MNSKRCSYHNVRRNNNLFLKWTTKEKLDGRVVTYSKMGKIDKEFDIHNCKPLFACPTCMNVTQNRLEDVNVSDWNKMGVVPKKLSIKGKRKQ